MIILHHRQHRASEDAKKDMRCHVRYVLCQFVGVRGLVGCEMSDDVGGESGGGGGVSGVDGGVSGGGGGVSGVAGGVSGRPRSMYTVSAIVSGVSGGDGGGVSSLSYMVVNGACGQEYPLGIAGACTIGCCAGAH